MDPQVQYLLSLQAIRDRARITLDAARAGDLTHFELHEAKLDAVAAFVVDIFKRDYGPDRFNEMPEDARWNHFETGGVPRMWNLLSEWEQSGVETLERLRRIVDLTLVSVLLDAGAGDYWSYTEPGTDKKFDRSEGLAIASLHMFNGLVFTANKESAHPCVDGAGLEHLSEQDFEDGFQVSENNKLLGFEHRVALMNELGRSLQDLPHIFGAEGRPGNLVDYLLGKSQDHSRLDVLQLWEVLQSICIRIWPKGRTTVRGATVGDAWPLETLRRRLADQGNSETGTIQPFHKLTQWTAYSLIVPFEKILGTKWDNVDLLTCLAEYRNGGLYYDMEVLSLKKSALERGLKTSGAELPLFSATDDVIVEWRTMTLALMDELYPIVLQKMPSRTTLTMSQMLVGTWVAGRAVALERRPETRSSPISIDTDGTLF